MNQLTPIIGAVFGAVAIPALVGSVKKLLTKSGIISDHHDEIVIKYNDDTCVLFADYDILTFLEPIAEYKRYSPTNFDHMCDLLNAYYLHKRDEMSNLSSDGEESPMRKVAVARGLLHRAYVALECFVISVRNNCDGDTKTFVEFTNSIEEILHGELTNINNIGFKITW